MKKKTSSNGTELIKRHEGCVLTAYLCPSSKLTIGYGHTGNDVFEGMVINQTRAEALLSMDLIKSEGVIHRLVTQELTQNQFDALVSIIFNIGPTNFSTSTLLKRINENPNNQDIEYQFNRWIYGTKYNSDGTKEKIKLAGLVSRRADEAKLYFT